MRGAFCHYSRVRAMFHTQGAKANCKKTKRYQIVHLFKTPLLLKKKQLLPQEAHKMTKVLYVFKTPPPHLVRLLFYHSLP